VSRPGRTAPRSTEEIRIGGRSHLVMDDLMPREARDLMLAELFEVFADAGVTAFAIKGPALPGPAVGVLAEQRDLALKALAERLPGPGRYLQEVYPGVQNQPISPLSARRVALVPRRCAAVRVAQLWATTDGTLAYGMDYGTVVEFWEPSRDDPDVMLAPLVNAASEVVHRDYLTPAAITIDGSEWPSVALFDRTFLTDVEFPVDAVYTWVDGADPDWRERFQRARAEADGVDYHPEAHAAHRYASRDELRYSMRSLEMYAPWIRHVYLVTDRQVPTWLVDSHPRLTVVDHRDIYFDPNVLPIFNSSAIITQLHHIEGLSEHYLYLNDDVFFGADVTPQTFWFGSGIAKVFPGKVTRPFGRAQYSDGPHINISRNIRTLMETRFGLSISTAIRHTPYPQLRSVNAEIEERFPEIINGTAARRFRHHGDIALDQLFHYYAQAIGRAVPSTILYDYVNVGSASAVVRLRRLLAARDRSVFCLNDAPEPGEEPIPIEEVTAFLQNYFPIKSSFER
jgi:hypothetical protein